MKETEPMNHLLARHFAGEMLSAIEKQEVEQWRKLHKADYERLRVWMEQASGQTESLDFDADAAWRKIEHRLPAKQRGFAHRLYAAWGIAASLLLVLGAAFWLWIQSDEEPLQYANVERSEQHIYLPDSSQVTLYPSASISYTIQEGQRQLTLRGKAFFKVKKQLGSTFAIDAGGVKVEVLGTSFLVDAASVNHVQVKVHTGRVRVKASDSVTVLTAGEALNIQGEKLLKTPAVLSFNNAPIAEVATRLEQVLDIRIELDEAVKQNTITTKLTPKRVQDVLRELTNLCGCSCDTLSPRHYKLHY